MLPQGKSRIESECLCLTVSHSAWGRVSCRRCGQMRSIPPLPVLGIMREFRKNYGLAQAENVVTNQPLAVLYEADLRMPSLTHEYYFVGGGLRAVKGGVSFIIGEKDGEAVRQVLGRLSTGMTRQPDVATITADSDFQMQTVTFSQWRDEQGGQKLLSFDSPKNVSPGGTLVILFDEKYFGAKDFFLEPDDAPKVMPIYAQLRKQKTEHEARVQMLRKGQEQDEDTTE